MAKAIGPTFGAEIEAAGLAGLAFSWTADGLLTFGDAISAEQRAAIEAVYAAHNPATQAPAAVSVTVDQLAALLVSKGTITADELLAASRRD